MKYGTHMVLGIVLALMAERVRATGQYLGCYDALPDGFSSKGEYSNESSLLCSNMCSGSDYFALYNGKTCYCGTSAPSSSADGTCDVVCAGYPYENCGGTSAYDIYAQADVDVSAISTDGSSSSAETSTSTSSTDSSTSSSTTASSSSTTSYKTSSTTSSDSTTATSSDTNETSSTTEQTTPSTTSTTSSTHTDNQMTTSRLTTIIENSSSVATSIIYVTQSISAASSATASSSASSTSDSTGTSNKSGSGSSKGAIIGGVVGGVLGAVVILVALLFLFRRRLFGDGYEDAESMMADDEAYEAALKTNPFTSTEDKEADVMMLGRRRLSEGSLADAADYQMKVLRVANPDDD